MAGWVDGHERGATHGSGGPVESRRSFLDRAGRVSAGLACVGATPWVAACASFPRVTPLREAGVARIPLSAFAETPGVLFDLPEEGMPVYVHRHGPDRFSAVLTRCAHRGCEVEPTPERMVCPCHGSEYTHDGDRITGPTEGPLTRYRTEREGDWVVVHLGSGGDR